LTSTATVSELVSETSLKGGGAYDLEPVILELKLTINDTTWNIRHPVRCSTHDGGYGFCGYILDAFDDQFIMDMTADDAVGEILHSEAEKIPADSLYNILYEFWIVGFDAFSLFCRTDTHVCDGFAVERIFTNVRLHIGEYSSGRKFNETVINPPAELGRLPDAWGGERGTEIKTSVV